MHWNGDKVVIRHRKFHSGKVSDTAVLGEVTVAIAIHGGVCPKLEIKARRKREETGSGWI